MSQRSLLTGRRNLNFVALLREGRASAALAPRFLGCVCTRRWHRTRKKPLPQTSAAGGLRRCGNGFLGRYRTRALPCFGHAAARPAARGLAEHARQFALRQRPARLEAGPVRGHRRSDGLALIAAGTGLPGTGRDLVRVLVRMVRRRGLDWSAPLVRCWPAGLDLQTTPATRHKVNPHHLAVRRGFGQAGPRTRVGRVVRIPAGVVRSWLAVQSVCCCGTDDPDQQFAHTTRPG
jgi:hypothetical protein